MITINRKFGTFVNHCFCPSFSFFFLRSPSLSLSLSLLFFLFFARSRLQPYSPSISCPSTYSIPKKPISDSTLVPPNPRKSGCRTINLGEIRQTLVDDLLDPSMKMIVIKGHGYFIKLVIEAKLFEGVISNSSVKKNDYIRYFIIDII